MTEDPTLARSPATPLMLHDPFFSLWSRADRLTDDVTRHWTGQEQGLRGLLRIDGALYRFIGPEPRNLGPVPAMEQVERRITPLQTRYRFQASGVALDLTFTSPLLPDDAELLGRPASYVDLEVASADGAAHEVCAYLEWSADWAVGQTETEIAWGRHRAGPAEAQFLGAAQQQPLRRSGDKVPIEWGYLFVASEPGQPVAGAFGEAFSLRRLFAAEGILPERDDLRDARPLRMPTISEERALAQARAFEAVTGPRRWSLVVAYDQVWAASYFDRRLRPYWSRKGQSAIGLVETAWAEREATLARAAAFDADLIGKLERAGGPTYARLGILALRQCLAGHILVEDFDGTLLHFSKENSSNGSMGTVDITYPSAPFFLYFNPALLEAQLRPVLDYAASGRWPFPFAPHDVGRYPHANGQNYGGGDRTAHDQMPVEESGNMLILVAALYRRTGTADLARRFWPQLRQWADYLAVHGLDPDNQLCTDDFAGHMPHNANLSIKAILGLGAFGLLCRALGEADEAERVLAIARDWAGQWQQKAADGDHTRLAFDRAGTWSQKYNLVWDRILGLDLFPASLARREMAHYRRSADRYGLPLDSRKAYTKLDWLVWSACLTGERADFDALLAPVAAWLDAAPARVPLSDWYETDTGLQTEDYGGFFARSVVGGIFIKLMLDGLADWPGQ